jgi:hypothetical protein
MKNRRPRQPVALAPATVAVAAVAVHAVVDVSTHAFMRAIRARLGVAIRALKDCVVIRIGMAGGAYPVGAAMIHVEPGVVESGPQPAGRGVAGSARVREANRNVIRVSCARVVQLMAAVAIGGHGGVVVVHVATGARHRRMRARQRERRVVVIERGRTPCRGAVTHVALLRKAGGSVVRIRGSDEIVEMARHACRVRQAIVRSPVTLAALQSGMRSGKRPAGGGMVERSRTPRRRAVADLALLR